MPRALSILAPHDGPLPDLTPAVAALFAGELVAFPTETVYGLGARASDETAVARIYAAKGRPADNPLIVHLAHGDPTEVADLVETWPDVARRLATRFWPGPLTLVARRHPGFPSAASAGRATIALRVPDDARARALVELAGPLAAPSANRSGSPSPTRAEHVLEDLGEQVAVVVDGGPCRVGVESTVLDVTTTPPMVLRPGSIGVAELRAAIGPVDVHPSVDHPSEAADARAPGMRHRHYSPRARVHLVHGPPHLVEQHLLHALGAHPRAEAAMVGGNGTQPRLLRFPDAEAMAHGLYAWLRDCDDRGASDLWVGEPDEQDGQDGLARALRNRLRKAADRRVAAGSSTDRGA